MITKQLFQKMIILYFQLVKPVYLLHCSVSLSLRAEGHATDVMSSEQTGKITA